MSSQGIVLLAVLLAIPVSGWCQADSWRAEATRIRQLADSDAPAAYRAAKSLEASFPADGTDIDRARVLNLLSRVETYLALTTLPPLMRARLSTWRPALEITSARPRPI
jgi:hypothetical protein